MLFKVLSNQEETFMYIPLFPQLVVLLSPVPVQPRNYT